jgi:GH24 family phage-related lysozyme (muramidase)
LDGIAMQISEAGLKFIEQNEGFSATVYSDNGTPCIGFGHHLLPSESFPDPITEAQAETILREDCAKLQPVIARLGNPSMTQGQFDALTDFGINLGVGTLQYILRNHAWKDLPGVIILYDHEVKDGVLVENSGLKARREQEVKMFLGG